MRILFSRCAALFRGRKLDEDVDAELRSHLELAVEEKMKRGMSAGEARTAALREFGGVTQRTREIAIRMALGASRKVVLLQTLRYALTVAVTGAAGGLIAVAGLMRFLKSLLYGVTPQDSTTIAGAVVFLLCCSVLAAWVPAQRAASIDPMRALRAE